MTNSERLLVWALLLETPIAILAALWIAAKVFGLDACLAR
jgi:hypothetical protein